MEKFCYQSEYENSSSFWKKEPSKFVKSALKYIQNKNEFMRVLDLGAGEGKNSVFLANIGYQVTSVDKSEIALSRFSSQPNYKNASERIKILKTDVQNLSFDSEYFDIVVAYGITHCLESKVIIHNFFCNIKKWTRPKGVLVACIFTDRIPPPICQPYLNKELFLTNREIRELLKCWKILEFEDDIITETHPTSKVEHQHSLARIIAEKI